MIDPADKQTAALPLEQPKRGRGRPTTGQAMTAAEKQKAYRERQKAQRNELEREAHNAYATSRVDESYSEDLFIELEAAKAETAAAIARAEKAEAICVTLRKKLTALQTQIKESVTENETAGCWDIESRAPGKRAWKRLCADTSYKSREKAEETVKKFNEEEAASGEGFRYRVVPAN